MSKNIRNALIVLVIILVWFVSGLFKKQPEDQVAEQSSGSQLTLVEVIDIEAALFRPAMNFNARTEAYRDVQIAAQTSGQIVSTSVTRGTRVEEGTILAEIDPEERELRVTESRAQVAQREIDYNAALELRNKNLLSESDVALAKASLEAARANLESSELELRRTEIRAPFEGVFNERMVELGDFIQRGQAYAQMLWMDPIKVVFQVTEKELVDLDTEKPFFFTLSSGEEYEGRFHYRSSQADPANRAFRVEALIDNSDYQILADLTGVVRLYGEEQKAHAVPAVVLTLGAAGNLLVKVLGSDSRVESYEIEIIVDDEDVVWVTGLPDKARVIVTGFEYVGIGEEVDFRLRTDESPEVESSSVEVVQ